MEGDPEGLQQWVPQAVATLGRLPNTPDHGGATSVKLLTGVGSNLNINPYNLLSPRAKQGGFLYLTRFVFFYKIGEGMDTAYKSVTFAAKIGTWLDSNRLYLY